MSDERPSISAGLSGVSLLRRPWLLVAAGFLLFTIAFHFEAVVLGRMYFNLDAFAYFYPIESYYAASLLAGRLPLWNPYTFAGVPFLANSQTGVYYPFNLAFLLGSVPYIYGLQLAGHSLLAALGMVWFGRRIVGLGWAGATVAGLVFGFGGALATLSGHLNQLQAAAWLPWILGVGHLLVVRPRLRPVAVLALLIAAQVLAGHSQQLFMSLWALAAYSVWVVLRPSPPLSPSPAVGSGRVGATRRVAPTEDAITWPALWPRLAAIAGALLLAAGLAAAQLAPTIELAGLSIRAGGLSYREAAAFSLPPFDLLVGLVPPLAGGAPFSEYVGYIGVTGLVLAVVALIGRFGWVERFWLGWCIVALILALGQFTPLYYLLYKVAPGFDLFRAPARWLFLFAFGASVLAGLGAEHVGRLERSLRTLGVAAGIALGLLALAGVYNLLAPAHPVERPAGWWWVATLIVALGLAVIRWRPRLQAGLLLLLLAGELLVASRQLDSGQTILADAYQQLRPASAHVLADNSRFRVLSVGETTYDPGDLNQLRQSLSLYMTASQVESYIVALKYSETFQPNLPMRLPLASLDGYDGGLLPLKRFLQLKRLFRADGKELEDGRLRYQLAFAPDPGLLGWLNVKYVMMDRTRDLWLDGVYYDLGVEQTVEPAGLVELTELPAFEATAVGLIVSTASLSQPPPVGRMEVTDQSGHSVTTDFDARQGRLLRSGRPELGAAYEVKMKLPAPTYPAKLGVSNAGGSRVVLRSVSLINGPAQVDRPVAVSPGYRISHLGDVKVYENLQVTYRVFAVGRVRLADGENDMLTKMQQADFSPTVEAVVLADDWRRLGVELSSGDPGETSVVEYGPGYISATYEGRAPALIVFTESYYPGWRAYVNGQERPVLLTNLMFQGVTTPAGQHQIEFRFEPLSVWAGQGLSAFSLLLVALLLVAGNRKAGAL